MDRLIHQVRKFLEVRNLGEIKGKADIKGFYSTKISPEDEERLKESLEFDGGFVIFGAKTVGSAETAQRLINSYFNHAIIYITPSKPTTDIRPSDKFELFFDREIILNPFECNFGATNYKIVEYPEPDNLPIISSTDPIVRWMGFKPNDVIEFTRKTSLPENMVHNSISLRVVKVV